MKKVSADKGLFVDDIRVVVSNDKGQLLTDDDDDIKQVTNSLWLLDDC